MKFLVLGGNGRLGSAILHLLNLSEHEILASFKTVLEPRNLKFDLEKDDFHSLPVGPGVAFICIGISNTHQINNDLSHSYFINVTQTLKLIQSLTDKNWRCIYFSSDVVGQSVLTNDSSPSNFYQHYFLQKFIVESNILEISSEKIQIVRLSKIVFNDLQSVSSILKNTKSRLRDNHFVSFVSFPFIYKSLHQIINSNHRLNFICGSEYFSYYHWAQLFKSQGFLDSEYQPYSASTESVFKKIEISGLKDVKIYSENIGYLFEFIKANFSGH